MPASFSRTGLVIRDEVPEPARTKLLAAYRSFRDASRAAGGTTPDVQGVLKGGLVYAVEMSVVEYVDPNEESPEWGAVRIFDFEGDEMTRYGQGL
jgi:hypothetical protein